MKKSEYINLSSKQIKLLLRKKRKEIEILESYCWEVERKEEEDKYILVKVNGCKGCELASAMWNNTCDHCDGYHYQRRKKKAI